MDGLGDTQGDMPFDDSKYYATATRGDVAGVALKVSIALVAVHEAMLDIKNDRDPSDQISIIQRAIIDLDKTFDSLTGWIPPS